MAASSAHSVHAHGRLDMDGSKETCNDASVRRGRLRALVQDFGPIWFTWSMNAGIISILMHQLPYQFSGEYVLSTIGYLVVLILLTVFSTLWVSKFMWFPGQAWHELTSDVSEISIGACWPISWLILSSLTSLIVSQAAWGGHAFTIVGYVMWWIGAAWIIGYLLMTFITIIRHKVASFDTLSPVVLIPAVGVATLATTGGLISSYSANISPRLAVPVIILSYLAVGIGLFMAIFLYTLLLYHLFIHGWPSPEQSAVMFVFVGPMGQSAAALQLLGSAANKYGAFAGYHKGTFLQAEAAPALDVAGILLALLLTGMGCIWALIAIYVLIERLYHRQLTWSPVWNSIIFPVGTLLTSFLVLSIEMDSPTFRTLTAGGLILLVCFFFLNLGFTIWKIARGRLLIIRENPRPGKHTTEADRV